jgi:hypothetical protein
MNFDGLGIGFEVEDDGAEKKVSGISDSVDTLWSSIKKAGTSVPRFASGITRGLNRMGEKSSHYVGMVTTAIGGMIDSAMDPKLDTAYASLYAGFNKEFSALTAGMKDTEGKVDQARRKIGGIAQGMGEDMNAAAQNWVAFERQGIALDQVLGTGGLSGTIRDMIKITSVFGIEGRQLANVAGSLKKSFGFTEEQIGTLGDKIVAVGREFDMGREALQAWPQIMGALNKNLADFGTQMSPETVDRLTTSIVQLGGGFHEALGVDATEATELAINAFSTLANERKNIARLAFGMGGPFTDFAKEVMSAGDDVNEVFNVMATGDPLKFMDMLREIGKVAQERGGETGVAFQRLNAVISDTLGPDMAFAVQGNWDNVTKKMQKMPEVLSKSKGTLKDVAKAHWKSSLTAGEAWEMMVNHMKDKVFRLSRGEVNKWKKDMRRGFKDSFDVVESFAKDDGPLGEVTRKLLAVQRVGLSALLPGLGAVGPMLGGITTQALPMLTALGSMGVRFSDLGKLAGVGGAGYLFFKMFTDGPDEVVNKLSKMKDSLFDIMENKIFTGKKHSGTRAFLQGLRDDLDKKGIIKTITGNLAKIPWDEVWDTIWGKTEGIARSLGGMLRDVPWEDVGRTAFRWIGKGIRAVVDGVWEAIFGGSEKEATDAVSQLLKDAVVGAIGIIKDVGKGALKGLWDSIFEPDSLSKTFKNILKTATVGFGALTILSGTFRRKMMGGLWGGTKKGANWLFGGQNGVPQAPRGGGGSYYSGMAGVFDAPPPPPQESSRRRTGQDGIPMSTRTDLYRQQVAAQSRLSGGVYMPSGPTVGNPRMVMGPGGWVPEGGLEGGKIRKANRRERFRQWRMDKKQRFGRSRVGRMYGGAKNVLGKVGGMGGVMGMAALFEGVNQLSKRTKSIQKITLSQMLSEQDKFLLKSQESFLGVAETIDAMFLGLPGTIGGALGVTRDDLTGFYHYMVASAEASIYSTVETFKFLGRSASNIWDNISAHAEMVFVHIGHGFELIKNSGIGIMYDIAESIESSFKGLGSKLMYPFEYLSFHLKGWMADFIESIFGKPGESNAVTEIISKVMGEDSVRGIQKYAKQAKDDQRKFLGGEKTFTDAYIKQRDKRAAADKAVWSERRSGLERDRRDINDQFMATRESINKRIRATSMDAISEDWKQTSKNIDEYSNHLQEEAQKNVERVNKAKKTMVFEDQVKNTAVAQAELQKLEKERSDIKSRRKSDLKHVASKDERAAVSSDYRKMLADNQRKVDEIRSQMESLKESMKELADRPIDLTVISKIDGREVARGVEKHQRSNARF